MKIALISPKAYFLSRKKELHDYWSKSSTTKTYRNSWSGINPGLLIVAALCNSSDEITIIDENIDEIDFSVKYDLVGITGMTQQAVRAYEIAHEFRNQNITVIMGGLHASVMPKEAIKHVDSVVIGEVEYLWEKIINDFKNKKLKSFYKSEEPVQLKDSPIPRYDLIKGKPYHTIWVQTTRGCPHYCDFCSASPIYGYKYRHKTVPKVIEEIKKIKSIFCNTRLNFGDDNLFVNKKYSYELLDQLKELKIRWGTQSDISIATNDELLNKIRESGCVLVFIGLESLTEDALKNINKDQWKLRQLKKYPEYIQKIQSHGISVMGAFILGFDSDDSGVFKRTKDFIMNNNLGDAQVSILTPFPGTQLRERLLKENRILNTSWDNYTFFDVNFKHPRLTKQELENGLLDIYQSINAPEFLWQKMLYFKEIHKKLLQGG